jgi:type I restriction enzyme S subunit
MRDGWRSVVIGDIAQVDIEREQVSAQRTYRVVGVLNAGQGLFDRGLLAGEATNYPALHRLRAGQVVMRKLTAWEGPVAVVPPEFDGYFVSTEFPTFSLDTNHILPEFMQLECQLPSFWQALKDRSTGTVQRRKRVNPTAFLTVPILLPPLADQRRIIDVVASLDDLVTYARQAASSYGDVARRLRAKHFETIEGPIVPAEEFFQVTMGRQRSPKNASGKHMIPYLRAANVKDGYLDLADVKTMNFAPAEQARFGLAPGDVLVTEGCGSLKQVGASAQWSGEISGPVCFQNTLLRIRARPGVSTPNYAYQWARYSFESGAFAAVASGTNIFHIGADRAGAITVTAVPVANQESTMATVEAADAATSAAHQLLERLGEARQTVHTDLLSGQHMIPPSYDELLEPTG